MDPFFSTLFPIVTLFFVLTDWPRLKTMSKGVKLAYAAFMALLLGMFAARAAGLDVPMPSRFFIKYVSPAVESMLGLH
jgi:hypothetical protein